ncbi:hypothetical protein [Rahnella bonaserana]|jgi:hypothetical protein
MYLDTNRLNLISHAVGRAVIEISLVDGLISKTALVETLKTLATESQNRSQMSLFYEAAEIVKQGSNTEIIYTDKVGFVGAMSEI